MSSDLVGLARTIATNAHSGQLDKAGRAYFGHVERVASRVHHLGVEAQAVAYLHDTIEDTELTAEDLVDLGVPSRLVEAVVTLSRTPHEPSSVYYGRIKADPLALAVKLADVADNSAAERLALLDEATRERLKLKYGAALLYLRM